VTLAYRRTAVYRRVLVHLVGGHTLEGVLYRSRGPLLVLRDVTLIDAGRRVPLDGEVVVERDRVEFTQVLP